MTDLHSIPIEEEGKCGQPMGIAIFEKRLNMVLGKSKVRNVAAWLCVILCVYFFVIVPVFQVGIHARPSVDLAGTNKYNAGNDPVRNQGAWWNDSDIKDSAPAEIPEGSQEVLSNAKYSLFFSAKTGEIALLTKSTKALWRSNPKIETEKQGALTGREQSQIVLGFYDAQQKWTEMNSYRDCVSQGKLKYQVAENKLHVAYLFTKNEVTENDIPVQISAPSMESLLKRLPAKDAERFKFQYIKRSIKNSKNETFIQSMKKKYPAIDKYEIYEIKDTNVRRLKEVNDLLEGIGYTQEELKQECLACGIDKVVEEKIKFELELLYTLGDNGLNVSLDLSKMKEPQKAAIHTLSVLEYFGAGSKKDDGYFMVCDGSGALIRFNNEKVQEPIFEMPVYGENGAFYQGNATQKNEKYSLPVYGIKNGKKAILIHQVAGESLSTVDARVAGQQDEYNCAYFKVIASQTQNVSISNGKTIVKYEEKPYRGMVSIQYTPLEEEQAGYNEMAKAYRSYLEHAGLLKKQEVKEKAPLQLSFLGTVPLKKNILGVEITKPCSLTNEKQLQEIIHTFKAENVHSMVVSYHGWFNNGVLQKSPRKIDVAGSIGGEKGLLEMLTNLREQNIDCYPGVSFLNVYEKGSGFSPSKDNIRKLSRDMATGYFYNAVNQYRRPDLPPIYQLSPRLLEKVGAGFIQSSEKIGLTALTLDDLGAQLSCDFNEKQPIDREEAKGYSIALLENLQKHELNMGMANPNLYALPYAKVLTDTPVSNSTYRICDQSVPFYQMVVRGYADCFTKPLNYAADYQTEWLKAIEYGVSPSYLLTYSDTSVLKSTPFNYYNKSWYQDWKQVIVRDYQQYAKAFDSLQGAAIVEHRSLGDGIFETKYENGTSVYVNYTNAPAVIDGTEIPARGFSSKGRQS